MLVLTFFPKSREMLMREYSPVNEEQSGLIFAMQRWNRIQSMDLGAPKMAPGGGFCNFMLIPEQGHI